MGMREIAEGYSMDYDKFGITGQHVYWEGINVTDDGTTKIPVIGDVFTDAAGTTFGAMFCIHVNQKVVASDSSVIQYTCAYSNEPIDNRNMFLSTETAPPTTIMGLPQDFEMSGEYTLFKVSDKFFSESNWKWDASSAYHPNEKIANAIPMRVRTYNRKFQKIVPSSVYADFLTLIKDKIGKVNSVAWEDGGAGSWLFMGARSEIFNDQTNNYAYKFDLNFSYRDPDGTNENGSHFSLCTVFL